MTSPPTPGGLCVAAPFTPPSHDPAKARFNDGKCDPQGRFWAGTMALDGSGSAGALYSLEPGGEVRKRLSSVGISNGLAWSLDSTRLYYIDTPQRCLTEFRYDAVSGAIAEPRRSIEFPADAGWPDGMTIAAEGKLWIAFWDGSAVSRWDPCKGRKLQEFLLPVTRPTSCALGGPKLDILYITSARLGLTETELTRQPLAGSIFSLPVDTAGISAFRYNDHANSN